MTEQERIQYEALPYPVSFSCVDMIVCMDSFFDEDNKGIAMITKKGDNMLRLPGGFIDPTDYSPKHAAAREGSEEINLEDAPAKWKSTGFSCLTRDRGRYNPDESKHRLRTHLMTCTISPGMSKVLEAGDDAETVQMVPLEKFYDIAWVCENVLGGHIPIIFWWLGSIGWGK